MARRKIVVALGGNAIQSGEATAGAQQEALEKTAEQLVKIMENDVDIVIAHGNAPQVSNGIAGVFSVSAAFCCNKIFPTCG
ncbi:amino acid kinase family protein, partial [Bacillus sp. HC-TM]